MFSKTVTKYALRILKLGGKNKEKKNKAVNVKMISSPSFDPKDYV